MTPLFIPGDMSPGMKSADMSAHSRCYFTTGVP